jgi:hypothetical protein
MNVQFLKRIEGVWTGRGIGVYPPTVGEFRYIEELTIKQTAKPIVWEFKSVTKHETTGKPMHIEAGFIRAPPTGSIELVASHPFGLTEISNGRIVSADTAELTSNLETLHRVPTATSPFTTGLRRVYEISQDNQSLSFTMDMATSNHPELQNHLICKLSRSK